MELKKMSEENMSSQENAVADTQCNCQKNNTEKSKKFCRCKIKKTVFWVLGSIVFLVAMLLIFRDMYIPYAVTKAGSLILGTKVELKNFSSSLTGKVDIQGLTVANPAGYHNPTAFELERVYVDMSALSIFSDEILIHEILVTGMKIDLESKLNRTNLGDIQKNVERLLPKKDKTSTQENSVNVSSKSENKKAKSVVIEKLNINNNSLSFSNSLLQLTINVKLIPISMTDIGKGQSITETLNEVLIRILSSAFEACSKAGGSIVDSLKNTGSLFSESAANFGKNAADSTKNIGKGVAEQAKKIFKGF